MKSIYGQEYKVFIALLKEYRLEAGVTQTEVAKILEINQAIMSKIEQGQRRLDVIELRKVCKLLKVPLNKFIKELDKRLIELEESA